MTNRHASLVKAVVVVVLAVSESVLAWSPAGTHREITTDAVALLSPSNYPDLHRFAAYLVGGSGTEAHGSPDFSGPDDGDDPEKPHRWWPTKDAWFQYRNNPDKRCALQFYEEDQYFEAYRRIGYIMHNTADESVPSHMTQCIHGHGGLGTIDGLEAYVEGMPHQYVYNTLNWTWTDSFARQWYYWLYDYQDDDDNNQNPDTPDVETLPDHGGAFNPEWGLEDYEFGTYGYGVREDGSWDPIPGANEGIDYFVMSENPNKWALVKQLLYSARASVADELATRSEQLPPLVRVPTVSKSLFGPEQPTTISFIVYENRTPGVNLFIVADSTPIKNTSGMTCDGSEQAAVPREAISYVSYDNMLPWKTEPQVEWNGRLASGTLLPDGVHTVGVGVIDQDGNPSPWTEITIKYDRSAPTVSFSIGGA
ncbi:MAG: hypothetical protein A2Y77_07950 [Planctomycetes bacterium RBG_13_62_9]|nr:MAG: hypothetical protein A2Y77_07950 [Planctomycetes bacterium RBG_13_62_9]